MTITATPTKLRNGAWGAKTKTEHVSAGQSIKIRTRAGKTWTAIIERVIWRGDGCAIVATMRSGGSSRGSSSPRHSSKRECTCGACDDLLSVGYRPGARVTCPECGGYAEAC